jgi:anti-repressor protein
VLGLKIALSKHKNRQRYFFCKKMNQLISISTNQQGENIVSARELYEFLEVKTEFSKWCTRMFEYGFVENRDYTEVTVKNDDNLKGGRSTLIDYALTLDTSKEIAMVQRTEKGKQARLYFIDCEKQVTKPKTQIEILLASVQMLANIEQKQNDMDLRITAIEKSKQIALAELNHIERSTEEVPEIGLRLKINQIVRSYSEKTKIPYANIWRLMYSKMLYSYRFNVNGYKKLHAKESKMDIVERENQLDNLFALVSKELI